jgi:hypothetical protein
MTGQGALSGYLAHRYELNYLCGGRWCAGSCNGLPNLRATLIHLMTLNARVPL